MKRIKISSIVTAGLLLVASAEFAMAMKGGFKPLETIHEEPGYVHVTHESANEAPSAEKINGMVEGNKIKPGSPKTTDDLSNSNTKQQSPPLNYLDLAISNKNKPQQAIDINQEPTPANTAAYHDTVIAQTTSTHEEKPGYVNISHSNAYKAPSVGEINAMNTPEIEDRIMTNYRKYLAGNVSRYRSTIGVRTAMDKGIIETGTVTDVGDGTIKFTSTSDPEKFVIVPKPTKDYLAPDKFGFMEFSNTPEYKDYILSESNLKTDNNSFLSKQLLIPLETLKNNYNDIIDNKIDNKYDNDSVTFVVGSKKFTVEKPKIYRPQSLDVNAIIDANKTPKEMNQDFNDLIMSTKDTSVLNDILKINSFSNNEGLYQGEKYPFDYNLYRSAKAKLVLNEIIVGKKLLMVKKKRLK